jgi:hypothetical protein
MNFNLMVLLRREVYFHVTNIGGQTPTRAPRAEQNIRTYPKDMPGCSARTIPGHCQMSRDHFFESLGSRCEHSFDDTPGDHGSVTRD